MDNRKWLKPPTSYILKEPPQKNKHSSTYVWETTTHSCHVVEVCGGPACMGCQATPKTALGWVNLRGDKVDGTPFATKIQGKTYQNSSDWWICSSPQNDKRWCHLVGGCWWLTYPYEKWWSSSVGMMTLPVYGKKNMSQTTNQLWSGISMNV